MMPIGGKIGFAIKLRNGTNVTVSRVAENQSPARLVRDTGRAMAAASIVIMALIPSRLACVAPASAYDADSIYITIT